MSWKQPIVFLCLAALIFGGAIWLSGREDTVQRNYQPMEPITIVQATDLHVLAPELTDGGAYFTQIVENADGKYMPGIVEITDSFIERMLALKPEALILSGDLAFNGETESHVWLTERLRPLLEAGITVLALPGNHDMNYPMAARFEGDSYELVETPDAGQFAELWADFGYADALARDEHSLSYVYTLSPGLRLLLVDTNTPEDPGAVLPETLTWIEQQLREAETAGARVIAVSHQTVLQHNSVFSEGFVINNREALYRLYQKYGVILNLCGHMHIQHTRTSGSLTEIVTSALCAQPCQYGVLALNAGGGSYHTECAVSPELAQAAADFFDRNSARQGSAVTEDPALVGYLTTLNRAYFSGCMDTVVRDNDLLKRWEAADDFTARYLESLLEDAGKNSNQLDFTF